MLTVPVLVRLATGRSGWPSPLKSATATAAAYGPAGYAGAVTKLGRSRPSRGSRSRGLRHVDCRGDSRSARPRHQERDMAQLLRTRRRGRPICQGAGTTPAPAADGADGPPKNLYARPALLRTGKTKKVGLPRRRPERLKKREDFRKGIPGEATRASTCSTCRRGDDL